MGWWMSCTHQGGESLSVCGQQSSTGSHKVTPAWQRWARHVSSNYRCNQKLQRQSHYLPKTLTSNKVFCIVTIKGMPGVLVEEVHLIILVYDEWWLPNLRETQAERLRNTSIEPKKVVWWFILSILFVEAVCWLMGCTPGLNTEHLPQLVERVTGQFWTSWWTHLETKRHNDGRQSPKAKRPNRLTSWVIAWWNETSSPGLWALGTAMFMTRLTSWGLGGEAVKRQMPDSDGVLEVRLSV